MGNSTALSIGTELNTLLGLRRFWVSLALNQYQSFITVELAMIFTIKNAIFNMFFYLDLKMKIEINWLSDQT